MLEVKKFQRKKENFICEHCKSNIIGDGYTNHCPECLWSKHVDIMPGDRSAICGGLMRPLSLGKKEDRYVIMHACTLCGHMTKVKSVKNDNMEKLIELASIDGQ